MRTFLLVAAVGAGWMVSGVLLAMVVGPQMRRSAAGLSSDLPSHPAKPRVVAVPPAAVTPWRRPGRWTVSAGFAAVAFAGSTGLAAAGALPQPVQGVAHSVLRSVGVSVPEVSGRGPDGGDPSPAPVAADEDSPTTIDDRRPDRVRRDPAVVARADRRAESRSTTSTTTAVPGTEKEREPVTTTEPGAGRAATAPDTDPEVEPRPKTVPTTVPPTTPTTPTTDPVFTPPPPPEPPPVGPFPPPPPPPPPVDPPPVEPPPVEPPPVEGPPVERPVEPAAEPPAHSQGRPPAHAGPPPASEGVG